MSSPGVEADLRAKISKAYGEKRPELADKFLVPGVGGVPTASYDLRAVGFDPKQDHAVFSGRQREFGDLVVELARRDDDSVVQKVTFEKTVGLRRGMVISRVLHEVGRGLQTRYTIDFNGSSVPNGYSITNDHEVAGYPDLHAALVRSSYKEGRQRPFNARINLGSLENIEEFVRWRQAQRESGLTVKDAPPSINFNFSPSGELVQVVENQSGGNTHVVHNKRSEHQLPGSHYRVLLDSNQRGRLLVTRTELNGEEPTWHSVMPDSSFATRPKAVELNRLVLAEDAAFLAIPDLYQAGFRTSAPGT